MKKKIILLCIVLTALILELLPYGAVCSFANPEGEPYRLTYSYFDITPYGYANFGPLITAILTCILTVMIILSLILKKEMQNAITAISIAAAVISPAPLTSGLDQFSLVGALISAALILAACISARGSFGKKG